MKIILATIGFLAFAISGFSQTFKPPGTNSTQIVELAWTPPTNSVTEFRLYIGNSPDTYTRMQVLPVGSTATVTNLTASIQWFFRVTAINALGQESRPSNEVKLAPLDPPSATRIVSVTVTTETTTTVPAQ